MRRLNRKGFTLIELLAVIVVLGLVMVVTIPSVVSAVKAARQGAYDDAISIIEKYVNDEYVKCQIDPFSTDDYNSELFDGECNLNEDISTIVLHETKYSDDISSVSLEYDENDDEYKVIDAPVNTNGKFKGVEDIKAFDPVTGPGDVSIPKNPNRPVIG